MPLKLGEVLEHYEILGQLGEGAAAEVYRAWDRKLGREVAVKVLPDEWAADESRLRRFELEAKTLAPLHHSNLAHIYGFERASSHCFIVMELVPGSNLGQILERGPMEVEQAIDLGGQIAEGLEVAHEAGVVHRDLKPANVCVTPQGVAKVLDFGLAKLLRTEEDPALCLDEDGLLRTQEGILLGTPAYMSPEQVRGEAVDRRADVWAFGCVLFESLTGKRAFEGRSFGELSAAIQGAEPDWGALPPATPAHVKRLLVRALDKDPRMRLRDIGEARIALRLGAPPEPPEPLPPLVETVAAGRPWGLVAVCFVALALWFLVPNRASVAPSVVELTTPSETRFRPTQQTVEEIEEAIGGGALPKIGGYTLVDREPIRFLETRVYHDTGSWHLRNAGSALFHAFRTDVSGDSAETLGSWTYYHMRGDRFPRRLVLRELTRSEVRSDLRSGQAILDRIAPQAYHAWIGELLVADLGQRLDLLPRVVLVTSNEEWRYRLDDTGRGLSLVVSTAGANWWTADTSSLLDRDFEHVADLSKGDFAVTWKELVVESWNERGEMVDEPNLDEFRDRFELGADETPRPDYPFAIDRLLEDPAKRDG